MPKKNRLGLIAGGILALIIIGYAISKSTLLIEGPLLKIDKPIEGETFTSPLLQIHGTAKNIAFLTLNGRQIYTNDSGNIYDELLLFSGYNVITVSARDRFGRSREIVRHIIYAPDKIFTDMNTATGT